MVMAYSPHTMLPADLREYAAPRGWWYLNRDKCVAIGCALLFAYYLTQPNAATQELISAPARAVSETGPAAAALGLCLRYQDGLPLRGMIQHQYASGWKVHDCWYGKIDRRDWQ